MSKQRVYTFSSNLVEELDKQVNDYIKSEKGLSVVSISHSSCPIIKEGEGNIPIVNYSVSLLVEYK